MNIYENKADNIWPYTREQHARTEVSNNMTVIKFKGVLRPVGEVSNPKTW